MVRVSSQLDADHGNDIKQYRDAGTVETVPPT